MPGASEHGISVQLDVNAIGKLNALLLFGYTHCLLTADGDNPYRGIVPSGIVCFSVSDAYSTWSCTLVTSRIRIDGAA